MVRIARRRVVILTWDNDIFSDFWLVRDYLPAAARTDNRLAVPMKLFGEVFGEVSITAVSVPHDCVDGFGAPFGDVRMPTSTLPFRQVCRCWPSLRELR
ncbi:hypothetical protein [Mycobacterium sp. 236(2023)]|uniref:hypothetical protein n=1 Tax=Mycobacterium sp. 236(2023) TaxID=3038163 RepID=UPI0024155C95|nr:hypothetical protein [Mycobacterium sp. 236(2023)]MDG4668022.1 hypothetical protein [Mycobacterium sp. 236(2023)]